MSKTYKANMENPTLAILQGENSGKTKAQAKTAEAPAPVVDADLMKNFVEPDRKIRSKRVQILITEEMYGKIKGTATAGRVSVNEVVNQALAYFYS